MALTREEADLAARLEVRDVQLTLLKAELEEQKSLAEHWKRVSSQRPKKHSKRHVVHLSSEEATMGSASPDDDSGEAPRQQQQETDAVRQEADALRRERDALRQERDALQRQRDESAAELQRTQSALREAESALRQTSYACSELRAELEQARRSVDALTADNAELRQQAERLYADLDRTVDESKRRAAELRGPEDLKLDQALRERCGLSDTEYVLDFFICASENHRNGWLYVTPEHLVFETSTAVAKLVGDSREVVPIRHICVLDKVPTGRVFHGHGLNILLDDGRQINLRGFLKRANCVQLVLQAAARLGTNIVVKRNGQLDTAAAASASLVELPHTN